MTVRWVPVLRQGSACAKGGGGGGLIPKRGHIDRRWCSICMQLQRCGGVLGVRV